MQYIRTPHEAEFNAERVMRSWGYTDAKATTGGADGGIDVRAKFALAQVKWRGGMAGRPDLQKLYGARGADTTKQLFFFAASGYTAQAVEYANQLGIALNVYEPTGKALLFNRVKWQGKAPTISADWVWLGGGVIALSVAIAIMVIAAVN